MATISSTGTIASAGIGSGLDVNGIVNQLVALEKQPLKNLQASASRIQTQLSAYGQLQSQIATLADAATKLASPIEWNQATASSSDSSVVGVTTTPGSAQTTQVSVQVQQLAARQSIASIALAPAAGVGSGTLVIQTGKWNAAGDQFVSNADRPPVTIAISAGANTPADMAAAINAAGAGIRATTITDASGTRLVFESTATGASEGFTINATETGTSAPGLAQFAYAAIPGSMQRLTSAQDAVVAVNGISINNASNQFDAAIPGLTFTAKKVSATPVELTVKPDDAARRSLITDFVSAYNAVTKNLGAATAYDSSTKNAGTLQGDRSAIGIQSTLRAVLGGSLDTGRYTRLVDAGIERSRDGTLSIAESKLNMALLNGSDMGRLFNNVGAAGISDGIAVRMRNLTNAMNNSGGALNNRTSALQLSARRNSTDQQKVTDHAALVEARLRAQYSALDKTMASMSALSSYVSQQVTNWNKSTSN